jgi:hypothetical protein
MDTLPDREYYKAGQNIFKKLPKGNRRDIPLEAGASAAGIRVFPGGKCPIPPPPS